MNNSDFYQLGWNLGKALYELGRQSAPPGFARKKASSKKGAAPTGRGYTRGAGKKAKPEGGTGKKRAKPKCTKGIACGSTCIPASRKCTSEAPTQTAKSAAQYLKKPKALKGDNPKDNQRKRAEDKVAKTAEKQRDTKPKTPPRTKTPAQWAKEERAKKPKWWGKLPDGVKMSIRGEDGERSPAEIRASLQVKGARSDIRYTAEIGKSKVPVTMQAQRTSDGVNMIRFDVPGYRLKDLSPREKVQAIHTMQRTLSAHLENIRGGERVLISMAATYGRPFTQKQRERMAKAIKEGRLRDAERIGVAKDDYEFTGADQRRFGDARRAMGLPRFGIVRNGVVLPTDEHGKPSPVLAREGVRLQRPGEEYQRLDNMRDYLGANNDEASVLDAIRKEVGEPAWQSLQRDPETLNEYDSPIDTRRAWDLTVGGQSFEEGE